MESRIVQSFGNSSHIVLPKEYIGRRVKFLLETKSIEDIKSDALDILKPHLGEILGVYIYGSYTRNEQTIDSDIDILVIADKKIKINKIKDYSISVVTLEELDKLLEENAVLVIPLLREAETIINPRLLEKYKECKFTKNNIKPFLESCKDVIKLNKRGIELGFDVGSIVYSLILRIRALFMIQEIIANKPYSKSSFFDFLKRNEINNVNELYSIYSREREGFKVKESNGVKKDDLVRLLVIAENMIKKLK
ncbi:nucleotidyltransferase domain-containing protein [Candidatus Woesearchaeota archaeon]|nr:nucleotidyltransferase domain-containing protein [Candidatus Woesearchaeota archaeon]